MDNAGLAAALGRLLPRPVRDDIFTPSACDLLIAHLERMASRRTLLSRAAALLSCHAALFLLFIRCWRFAPSALTYERRDRRRLTRPQPWERLAMIRYTIRHAARLLVRERAFTATAALTLALGVGANVAIFAVVEAVLLRPLPYEQADDLLVLKHRDQRTGVTKEFIALGDYIDLRARQDVFEAFGTFGGGSAVVNGHGEPFRISVLSAGAAVLEALKVEPAAGRNLVEDDCRAGAMPVAMISHALWLKLFSGDVTAIGRTLDLGATKRQVVGVASPGFRFPADAATDVIVPSVLPATPPANRKGGWVFAIGRLKPGVDRRQVDVQLAAISSEMEAAYPESNAGSLYYAVPLRDHWLGEAKTPLVLMLVGVGLVLLIACANVGNLLLARALSRRQEMSVRVALGAGRGHLVGQLLAESLALTVVAGGVGLLIAHWAVPALVALVPASVSIPGLSAVGINRAVLWYALGILAAAALAFAGLSAVTVRRESGHSALMSQNRVAGGPAVRRMTSALIVIEVALSVILLIGAGLIVRTFAVLLSTNPGFEIDGVALVEMALPAQRYQAAAARQSFFDRAFAALGQLPGVQNVGAAAVVPLTGNNWTVPFDRADRPVPAGTRPPDVGWQSASGGYFKALRIPLLSGRLFDARDSAPGAPVVIISRAVEKQFFDGQSAVGRKVRVGAGDAEIVGVVGDIRRAGLAESPRADMYFPFERVPGGGTTIFIRGAGDPRDLLPAAQAVLRGLEPAALFGELRTMRAVASQSIASTRLVLWLLGIFAVVALALAAVGVYGVMSYVVRQRTREFGTRVALGATPGDVLWLVMRQGGTMTLLGGAIGLGTGLLLARSMASLLYGVSAHDPVTVLAVLTSLLVATMAACYVPARRAMRLDAARTLAEG